MKSIATTSNQPLESHSLNQANRIDRSSFVSFWGCFVLTNAIRFRLMLMTGNLRFGRVGNRVKATVDFHLLVGPNRQVNDASWEPGYKMYTNTNKYEPESKVGGGGGGGGFRYADVMHAH